MCTHNPKYLKKAALKHQRLQTIQMEVELFQSNLSITS